MLLRIILLALAFALATAVLGWWTVPVLGALWGWIAARDARTTLTASAAAGAGWVMLLAWTAFQGPVGDLARKVGAIVSLPGWTLILLTLVFAVMLAGSAAAVFGFLRELLLNGKGEG